MKDDRREDAPNVQLWSREGFGGPLSLLIRPTNGTEYISSRVRMRRAAPCWDAWFRPIKPTRKRLPPSWQRRRSVFGFLCRAVLGRCASLSGMWTPTKFISFNPAKSNLKQTLVY